MAIAAAQSIGGTVLLHDDDEANGRLEEKTLRQNVFLIFYITFDTLSYTGKGFQRSIFIIIKTK